MSIRNHLIKLQKETFLALKQEILDKRRFEEKRITNYRKKYLSEVKNYQEISSKKDLFSEISNAKIVFCGDFHTLSRSQYTAIKILEFLAEKGKKVKLALEMIPRMYEDIANDFVEGRYDEETFLNLIHYEKIWGFPWEHYRPIFELAKKYQFSILGINTSDAGYQPLHVRDRHAAKAIYNCVSEDKEVVVFCLYGDLHLADAHIPQKCKNLFKKNNQRCPKMITVFQNSDEIYWKLVEKDMIFDVDVVKIKKDKYCVLSSTPWVKWQSYQSWMEDHIAIMDSVDTQSWDLHYAPDYFHDVREHALQIKKFLKIRISEPENLQVYSSHDIEVIEIVNKYIVEAEKRVNPVMQDMIDIEMIENRCLFLPHVPLIFLQDVSSNRIAQKASQWVALQLSPDFTIYDANFSSQEHFYRILMIECVGFFGAKIINPKKKTSHLKDFERYLHRIKRKKLSDREKLKKTVAICALEHQALVRDVIFGKKQYEFVKKLDELDHQAFFLCARSIGRMMGDYLFSCVMKEQISITYICTLFSSFTKDTSAIDTFLDLTKQFAHQGHDDGKSKDEFF